MIYGVFDSFIGAPDVATEELVVVFGDEALADAHAIAVSGYVREIPVLERAPESVQVFAARFDSLRERFNDPSKVLIAWGTVKRVWDYEDEYEAALALQEPVVRSGLHPFRGDAFWVEARARSKRAATSALSARVAKEIGKSWTWTGAGGRWV